MDIAKLNPTYRPNAGILAEAADRSSKTGALQARARLNSESFVDLLRTYCARQPGSYRLGAAEELASQFGVGKRMVRIAIRELEREGIVQVTKGRRGGAFIHGKPIGHPAQLLCDHLTLTGIQLPDVKSATTFLLWTAVELICLQGGARRPDALAAAEAIMQARELDCHFVDVDKWCAMRGYVVESAGNPALSVLHDAFQAAYSDALASELQMEVPIEAEGSALLRLERYLLDQLAAGDLTEVRVAMRLISNLEMRFLRKSLSANHLCRTLKPENLYGRRSPIRKGGGKLAHQTLRALHAHIRHRAMGDGARLGTLAELAPSFGVGEDVMRETLALASSQGLVSVKRGRNGGIFVSQENQSHGIRTIAAQLALVCSEADVAVIRSRLERSNVSKSSHDVINAVLEDVSKIFNETNKNFGRAKCLLKDCDFCHSMAFIISAM